ncbi:protein-disulfide reductase DsbD [Pandoraea apista]|uniref:Thiol:disulfide interchange protein DsbD n=1 Tax=Pandoraea apista TaxID=93218 RepID=A0ABX9ZVA7_9BURK|nr:thiol:disulfide interchange protein [Pandoraea apista]RRJ33268.1 protein-disulfide reductase DsbD [Pandoraea apista]RRJ80403.1 protein-disulfide reductase DsbD [Pandoraea apista]RSD15111.1 protein-disulfide reductase DsbD [Pandoraea apista]RSK85421.1 protein-disulfide reductase DsbD [Pandoraea apista]
MQFWVLAWLVVAMLLSLGMGHARAADDFLDPDVAFKVSKTEQPGAVLLHFEVAKGYYLYRDRFAFAADNPAVKLGTPEFPKGEIKHDETFGKDMEVYHEPIDVRVPVVQPSGPFTLNVTMQGCADKGLCYPPMDKPLKISADGLGGAAGGSSAAVSTAGPTASALSGNGAQVAGNSPEGMAAQSAPSSRTAGGWLSAREDYSEAERILSGGSFALALGIFFALGVGLAFTPCVLPMVPILLSIVAGQEASRGKAIRLAIAYVLGMAVVNTVIGVAAGLLGQGLIAFLQAPWVLALFALLMVVLSLSMFGMYELQLPSGLRAKIDDAARKQKSGQWIGAAMMGVLSGLIVSPCVTAPLAAALAFIAKTGDAVFGGATLFALSLGMGLPLVILAGGGGALLPRAGAWMDGVKRFFGFLLLGVALWIVRPLLPTPVLLLGWGVLLLVAATFMRVFDSLPEGVSGARRLLKGLGVVVALLGAVALVGAAAGARDPLVPLAGLTTAASGNANANASAAAIEGVRFQRVRSVAELEKVVATAGRPVMFDFYADWCISCKEMERFVFTDPKVKARLDQMVLVQADVTANNADDQALLKRFGLFGPPGIIFFDASGKEVADTRVIGAQSSDQFLRSLDKAYGPAA